MDGAANDQVVTLDLRSGQTIWERDARPFARPTLPPVSNLRTDVIVVGAGITGAFLAERFTREGRKVAILDRHMPRRASTAASTALLQWEIDAPMLELEGELGFEAAAAIYRRSVAAVRGIGHLAADLGNAADFSWRPTLFLAGNELGPADLREELRLRLKAGIEGEYLGPGDLAARFGFDREGALLHAGSAVAHPMNLANMLLSAALSRGATLLSPALVVDYDTTSQGVSVRTEAGLQVDGEILVLANGYELPPFVEARVHRITSTWAFATRPQAPGVLWPDEALVWEASEPYAYMRSTTDGRIVFGGEDEDIQDADRRDALLPEKIATLRGKLAALVPAADTTPDATWTGFFSETEDGLPLIGAVPGRPRTFAAFGYGGNGITFSAIAADMIARLAAGQDDPAREWFAVDRG
ncbi:FAD-binding oxidoreductase [uncultured Alsobacter sp.]|uniref:NAD(P)/FAD-dependent oxidoreductase n=1 Tax=uncultured Alsobacter sp. TaxID=1748258 RepID=UPI0025D00FC3|nr:FAD-dependent oxidoreductase [uncultured Alsobacter sp.]